MSLRLLSLSVGNSKLQRILEAFARLAPIVHRRLQEPPRGPVHRTEHDRVQILFQNFKARSGQPRKSRRQDARDDSERVFRQFCCCEEETQIR